MIKVSVIVPVYNAEKYLEETLECLIHQTLQEIEIICVDDGSTDQSCRILDRYRNLDARILVLSQENTGAGAARNLGLMHSSGEYLSILDADDVFEQDLLETSYAKAKKDQADICVFKMDQFTEETRRRQPCHWSLSKWQLPDFQPFTYRDLKENIFKVFVGWTWDKLFRRDFILANGILFQQLRTSNDLFFTFTALVKAERISTLSRTLVHQRIGLRDSLSATREKSWDCFYQALLALREELIQMGIYEEVERSYINYALHFTLWNLNSLRMPVFQKLYHKFLKEYSKELGIEGKNRDYFWNKKEYQQYEQMLVMTPEQYRAANQLEMGDQVHFCRASEVWEECERTYRKFWKESDSRQHQNTGLQVQRYRICKEAFEKVADVEKWKFVHRMQEGFCESFKRRELEEEAFEDSEWDEIQQLMGDPQDYYMNRCVETYKKQEMLLEQENGRLEEKISQLEQEKQQLEQQIMHKEGELVQKEVELSKKDEELLHREKEIMQIRSSTTWKLGSMLTYVPRKISGRRPQDAGNGEMKC